jgi:hypothetical protein
MRNGNRLSLSSRDAPSAANAGCPTTRIVGAYSDTDDELVFFCPECADREFEGS